MALLTGPAIHHAVSAGKIVIKPYSPEFLGTNSYDCHLGDTLCTYGQEGRVIAWRDGPGMGRTSIGPFIDSMNPPPLVPYALATIGGPGMEEGAGRRGWPLFPGTLYLGRTREYTETWGYVPRIDGRSTCGRLGVFGHITAGQGDNGFCGTWTLEITVVEPVIIYPGQRLFQLRYDTQEGAPAFYGKTANSSGRYQNQVEPGGAKTTDG